MRKKKKQKDFKGKKRKAMQILIDIMVK